MNEKKNWSVFYRKPAFKRELRCFKQMTDNTKVRSSTSLSVEQIESKLLQLAKAARKSVS